MAERPSGPLESTLVTGGSQGAQGGRLGAAQGASPCAARRRARTSVVEREREIG
eukprot:CAMPEP_0206836142 /NCGR_PEP_ID=MMETSP0975-20121206/19750_1 /ASSEMBLY_ACC=CAM_ASM_000399 /TAXON_ID=483370 /ORGANISM="non described non described, Strain CCMP2097" /LENGTH=53 /DNA_ID=CAMNT_0054378545 /DNA_START=54 /DNA_END=211 /DNA_ORIENTATION=-